MVSLVLCEVVICGTFDDMLLVGHQANFSVDGLLLVFFDIQHFVTLMFGKGLVHLVSDRNVRNRF